MTELVQLKILTADSVDVLRGVSLVRPQRIWATRFDDLVGQLDLTLVPSEYVIDPSIKLHMPESGRTGDRFDAQNAYRALRALPQLTRADATDERLWVTLALHHYGEYLHARWPFPAGRTTFSSHLKNHLFTPTFRIRERDHAISRLWWTGTFVRSLVGEAELSESLHGFYANSEIPVQVLGRPNIITFPNMGRAIIRLCVEQFKDDPDRFDRDSFRAFLTQIDYRAGRASIGAMSDESVTAMLSEIFHESFATS